MSNTDASTPQPPRAEAADSVATPKRRNHKLTTEQKEFVVRQLAGFETASAVARQVRERFGVAISRQCIERYDPTRSPKCPQRWARQFDATRRAIIKDKAAAGAAQWKSRRRPRQRILLRSVEALAERILRGADQDGGREKALQLMTDRECARVLLDFIERMKAQTGTASLAEAVAQQPAEQVRGET